MKYTFTLTGSCLFHIAYAQKSNRLPLLGSLEFASSVQDTSCTRRNIWHSCRLLLAKWFRRSQFLYLLMGSIRMSLFSKMLHYYDSGWYLQNKETSGRTSILTFCRHQLMISALQRLWGRRLIDSPGLAASNQWVIKELTPFWERNGLQRAQVP